MDLHELSDEQLRKGIEAMRFRVQELEMRERHPKDFPTHETGTASSKADIRDMWDKIHTYENELRKRRGQPLIEKRS